MVTWQLQKNKTFFGFFIDKTQNIVYNINIKIKIKIKIKEEKQMLVSMTFLVSVTLFGWVLDN